MSNYEKERAIDKLQSISDYLQVALSCWQFEKNDRARLIEMKYDIDHLVTKLLVEGKP